MKFRKKPVVIEAIQFQGNFDEIEKFVGGDAEFRAGELFIATLEGPLRAAPNDWIIRGVKGEFYPCKPDIFAMTYEHVLEADPEIPENEIRFTMDSLPEPVLQFRPNGEIYVHGRLAATDQAVVDGMRDFLQLQARK